MQIIKEPLTLSAALIQRRKQLRFNLREAAKHTGVISGQQFADMEKDKSFNPTYVVMVGLCRFLRCDLNTLGRYIAGSQVQAGTITNGSHNWEVKGKDRTEARRATLFDVLHPVTK